MLIVPVAITIFPFVITQRALGILTPLQTIWSLSSPLTQVEDPPRAFSSTNPTCLRHKKERLCCQGHYFETKSLKREIPFDLKKSQCALYALRVKWEKTSLLETKLPLQDCSISSSTEQSIARWCALRNGRRTVSKTANLLGAMRYRPVVSTSTELELVEKLSVSSAVYIQVEPRHSWRINYFYSQTLQFLVSGKRPSKLSPVNLVLPLTR